MKKHSRIPSLSLKPLLVKRLLGLYDCSHPNKPGQVIKGYDTPHALRTSQMCSAVARHFNFSAGKIQQYEISCLLHDIGRVGLDPDLFGKIWSWARLHGIPTRPAEWRAKHPGTPSGRETEAFVSKYRPRLEALGIPMDKWSCEQVEMRLGFARRLKRHLRRLRPELDSMKIVWAPWMEKVMLYYYYPEKLHRAPRWVRQLAEILVACEQLEAFSNRQRGKDYYTRTGESFAEAFGFLNALQKKHILSPSTLLAVRSLVSQGTFDSILSSARGRSLSRGELRYLHTLQEGAA